MSDPSGVDDVRANFILRGRTTGEIDLRGKGDCSVRATVTLEAEVTEDMPPGEYTCFALFLTDCRGNQSSAKPNIKFRIEGIPGDREGPVLTRWNFA